MHMTPQKKKARAMWVGVGIGWSAFWLARYLVKRKPLVETNTGYGCSWCGMPPPEHTRACKELSRKIND